MKKITVSLPDEVYPWARVWAAERGSSVSAIVTEFVRWLSQRPFEFARLEAQQRRIQEEIERFRAGDHLSREETHDRAIA